MKFWKDFAAVLIILSLCRTTNCVFNPVPWEPGWMSIRRDFLRSGGFAVTLGFHEFEGNYTRKMDWIGRKEFPVDGLV